VIKARIESGAHGRRNGLVSLELSPVLNENFPDEENCVTKVKGTKNVLKHV
jgi:hypothetical protein